ncbi:hypothetical protein [Chryseobacterium sp. JM1]|nr:hypothetical protein [Chryseobacterium sp. JM1]
MIIYIISSGKAYYLKRKEYSDKKFYIYLKTDGSTDQLPDDLNSND